MVEPRTPRVTPADVDAASRRLFRFVPPSPFVLSTWLSDLTRADVWLKLESVQPTGSFKVRGAMNALLALRERAPSTRAVVTASAGNHGLALTWAGAQLGIAVRAHVPAAAPAAKRDAMRRAGATLVDAPTYDEAEARAHEDADAHGLAYVSPYNDPDVIAGAGTIALEMLVAKPDLDVIVAPLGGGGLLAGAAIVAKSRSAPVTVIGAEVEASPVFTTSLASGRITRVAVGDTLADGLAGNLDPGSMTFDLVRAFADRVTLVSEASLETAMRELVARERLVVEGASAAGVAAVMHAGADYAERRVGIIITGRNVDWQVLRRVLGV
jgi:threonine dehydratase